MRNTVLHHLHALLCATSLVGLACGGDPGSTSSASEGSTGGDTTGLQTTGEAAASTTGAGETTASSGADETTLVDPTTSGTSSSTTGDSTTGDGTTGSSTTGDPIDETTGTTTGGSDVDALVMQLEQAVDGVLFLSESDYPWTVVSFAGGAPVTEANVKALIAPVYVPHEGQATLEERAIEVRTPAQLFDPLTTPQDWWTEFETMQAEQYTQLRELLEGSLQDLQVFRFGELSGDDLQGAIDVYVLGETASGDVVGMWTVSVET